MLTNGRRTHNTSPQQTLTRTHTHLKKMIQTQARGSHQGTTPKPAEHLCFGNLKKGTDGQVCSFTGLTSLQSDPIRLLTSVGFSMKLLLKLYKANREGSGALCRTGCLGRLRTSAFLQPVATIDPLAFLLLTDLDVLLNIHSWRGRDRHSWKHKKGPRCR